MIAHEVGHALLMSFGGNFDPKDVSADYEAFHEASADWASMVAALHFDSVLNELMESAGGDLDTSNRLNRFSEFSPIQQVRMANNPHTMWDFQRGWTSEHDLAQPFIAAMFDAFVEIYNEMLVAAGAIPGHWSGWPSGRNATRRSGRMYAAVSPGPSSASRSPSFTRWSRRGRSRRWC